MQDLNSIYCISLICLFAFALPSSSGKCLWLNKNKVHPELCQHVLIQSKVMDNSPMTSSPCPGDNRYFSSALVAVISGFLHWEQPRWLLPVRCRCRSPPPALCGTCGHPASLDGQLSRTRRLGSWPPPLCPLTSYRSPEGREEVEMLYVTCLFKVIRMSKYLPWALKRWTLSLSLKYYSSTHI